MFIENQVKPYVHNDEHRGNRSTKDSKGKSKVNLKF